MKIYQLTNKSILLYLQNVKFRRDKSKSKGAHHGFEKWLVIPAFFPARNQIFFPILYCDFLF